MSLLEADRRRIAEIDAQISELETALSDLRAKKAFAQERLDSYKYPVLTLPPEIVSEIFTHFLPTYPDRPYLTGGLSPRRLTHICRAWRDIALGTPSLWRAMILHREGAMILHPEGDDIPLAQLARELDIWARRSGRCPMAVEFEFLPDTQLSAEVLLTSIAAQSARLEYLVLYLEDTDSLHPFSGPMPRLRHLDLNFEDDESTPVLVFSEAPLLRTALLTFNPAKVGLPWAQLTSLTLRYVYPSECSPVLEQSPNLIFCHLHLISDDDNPNFPDITLRSLTSLKLEEDPITDYLNTLTVPSLRCLDLTEDFLGSDPLRYLASFISKSGCKLQELIMSERHGISRNAYREAFPSINFSFVADGEATDGSEASG
ncbi:hypothetical protein C8R46DRAFT_3088 [Mycena filopes]|nr:hypothetical protein C8R46DRAFT_3088 [Mycena filopes]